MKKYILILLLILTPLLVSASFWDWFTSPEPLTAVGGGLGTIQQLDQWRATTTPYNAITPNVAGKNLYMPFSSATTSNLYTTDLTVSGTCTGCGGGGLSFGQSWEIISGFLTPTTTIITLLDGGFISNASSTLLNDVNIIDFLNFTSTSTSITAPSATDIRLYAFTDVDHPRLAVVDLDGVELVLARDSAFTGRNNTAAQIDKGDVVYISGQQGNSRPTIALANADDLTKMPAAGVAAEDIAINGDGLIVRAGVLSGLDTSAFTAGDNLFVGTTTDGILTNVSPVIPTVHQGMGQVYTSNAGAGKLSILTSPDFHDGMLSTGAIPFGDAGTALQDILNFVWDNTNKRLGIGTSSPYAKLSVVGQIVGEYFTATSTTETSTFPNLLVTNITGVDASEVAIALGGGSPTIDQVQEYMDNTGSSGFFLGGALSDGGSGTLDVSAGSGFIRTTNDDNAELQSFKWNASSTIAVADNTTQYVYVDDSGVISLSTNEFLETPDKILIGVVTDEGATIESTFALGVRLNESIGEAGRFMRGVHGITRNTRVGGLIFGQSGNANRDVTMTTGQLEWGRTSYTMSDFNTSGADTFTTYSANGQEDATASQWPNEQFDNAGTLTNMANNKWANLFFWLEPNDKIIMVYGRDEFVSQAGAEAEDVPSSSLPTRITETGLLATRFTFQKSSNTATIESAFATLFANAAVSDHGNLAGLSGDDHPQYLLADGTRSLTGNWDVGGFNISDVGTLTASILTATSTSATSTLPILTISTALEFFSEIWYSLADLITYLESVLTLSNLQGALSAGQYGAATIDGNDINSNIAGRSLTLTGASPDTLDIDVEIYTDLKSFNYASSTMATSTEQVLSWLAPHAITISTITCNEVGGSATSTIMFEERTAFNTTGTDVLYGNGITAGGDIATASSTLSNNSIASGNYLSMLIEGYLEGTPNNPVCDVEYTKND